MDDYLGFEWDPTKETINHKKHGVSFGEAYTVFLDENAICIFDEGHSAKEPRYIMLGLSEKMNLLVVAYCLRGNNIRIISARKANKHEEKDYNRYGKWFS